MYPKKDPGNVDFRRLFIPEEKTALIYSLLPASSAAQSLPGRYLFILLPKILSDRHNSPVTGRARDAG